MPVAMEILCRTELTTQTRRTVHIPGSVARVFFINRSQLSFAEGSSHVNSSPKRRNEGIVERDATGSEESTFRSKVDIAFSKQTSSDDDDVDLVRLTGHKPVLERSFSLFALLSFSFMIVHSSMDITMLWLPEYRVERL